MHNISNELLIESTEINLMVTEGLADKSKKTFITIIKKIKEFIRKAIAYIKSKLSKKAKVINNDIKKIKVHGVENTEDSIIIVSTQKLNRLLDSIKSISDIATDSLFSNGDDLDKFYDNMADQYETLNSLYEGYKENIDETYNGAIGVKVAEYEDITEKCDRAFGLISSYLTGVNKSIDILSTSIDELDNTKIELLRKIQSVITKTITISEFVIKSCERGVHTIANIQNNRE